ncbi:STAS domain-containing protein [Amycolatopsis sp. CA-126428]|uniref:STAS domain-containing protein n=1 Tax=Amycolatopsis sp. CA-126428 TaxID=2073158 RepID=UPI000CD14BA9|nr:STAS domain-containing protein [Amycolatopsis sp. CA-126428]
MSATTEPHDSSTGLELTADVITVKASSVLDAGSVAQLSTAASIASPGAALVVDLTAVSQLSLEAAAALMTLTRRCQGDGRTVRILTSAAARRRFARLGLDVVLPLHPPA